MGAHCRASGGMAIFLGVSAAPERILLSKISYAPAPVQHSSLHKKVLLCLAIPCTHTRYKANQPHTVTQLHQDILSLLDIYILMVARI